MADEGVARRRKLELLRSAVRAQGVYSVTASNDLSVIAMKSRIIKSKTLPHYTNCIGYSDLGYSDKPVITIGRREAKRTKLYNCIYSDVNCITV